MQPLKANKIGRNHCSLPIATVYIDVSQCRYCGVYYLNSYFSSFELGVNRISIFVRTAS